MNNAKYVCFHNVAVDVHKKLTYECPTTEAVTTYCLATNYDLTSYKFLRVNYGIRDYVDSINPVKYNGQYMLLCDFKRWQDRLNSDADGFYVPVHNIKHLLLQYYGIYRFEPRDSKERIRRIDGDFDREDFQVVNELVPLPEWLFGEKQN
jgi:hypothetical protein